MNPAAGYGRPHRYVGRCEPLGHRHDVGNNPIAVTAEPVSPAVRIRTPPHPARAAHHVGRTSPLPRTNSPQAADIPPGGLHRLHYHGGDGARIAIHQLAFQCVDLVGRNLSAASSRGPNPDRSPSSHPPKSLRRSCRGSPGAATQSRSWLPGRPAASTAGHLEGGLYRLGAGVGEKDVIQIARSSGSNCLSQLLGPRMAVAEQASDIPGCGVGRPLHRLSRIYRVPRSHRPLLRQCRQAVEHRHRSPDSSRRQPPPPVDCCRQQR